jgi:hypothetical protein
MIQGMRARRPNGGVQTDGVLEKSYQGPRELTGETKKVNKDFSSDVRT